MRTRRAARGIPKASTQTELVELASLKPAPYNPRNWTTRHLRDIERSLLEFGVVDPLIARREDNLVIGGHLRLHVLRDMKKRRITKRENGEELVPEGKVPVIYVDHLDDAKTKILNLALNKVQGDWDYGALAKLLEELSRAPNLDLRPTGFNDKEIDEYLDLVRSNEDLLSKFDEENPTFGVNPRLIFEFASKEMADAVKVAVAEQAKKNEPAGETLARMLGVVVKKKRSARSES